MRRVLVTGAGGFLGGWFAEALHLQGRDRVVAGVNRWSGASRIARFPIDFIQANLLDATSIDAALEGIDAVIHCAVIDDIGKSRQATRNLLAAMQRKGTPQLVHISSVGVYGGATGVVDEETIPVEPLTEYGRGKQQTEAAVSEFAGPNLKVSVLRPSLIYGPFSASWTLPVISRIKSGRWRSLGQQGEGRANLVYVGDVIGLAQFLLDNQQEPLGIYNSNGPDVPTWNEYYERVSQAMGTGPLQPEGGNLGLSVAARRPVRAVGKYVLKHHRELLMKIASRNYLATDIMRRTEEDLRLKPNDTEMDLFRLDVVYSIGKAHKLGFTPKTKLDQGISRSLEWARSVGLL